MMVKCLKCVRTYTSRTLGPKAKWPTNNDRHLVKKNQPNSANSHQLSMQIGRQTYVLDFCACKKKTIHIHVHSHQFHVLHTEKSKFGAEMFAQLVAISRLWPF